MSEDHGDTLERVIGEWTADFARTGPVDRNDIERTVDALYELSMLKPPSRYIWFASPLEAGICLFYFFANAHGEELPRREGRLPRNEWKTAVAGSLSWKWPKGWLDKMPGLSRVLKDDSWRWEPVAELLRKDLREIWSDSQYSLEVHDLMYSPKWISFRVSSGMKVRDWIKEEMSEVVKPPWDGARWPARWSIIHVMADLERWSLIEEDELVWLPGIDAAAQLGLVDVEESLHLLVHLAKAGVYCWPLRDACFLAERPSSIVVDDKGRLHNEKGPAVDYGGSWGLWAWHGVKVTADVFEIED